MTDWRTRAACRGMNPDVFHPARGDQAGIVAAQAICAGCPVATECLGWALDTNQKQGVWGGATIRERRELRKTWQRQVTCRRCPATLHVVGNEPWYCQACRLEQRRQSTAAYSRVANYDPKRCPVCTCEFTGGRDCCSPICARVYRKRQVAS